MKIYTDKDLQHEVQDLNLGVVQAGEKKQFIFYVVNSINASLSNLTFTAEHSEVSIVKAPEKLKIRGKEELIIEWEPSVTLKEGLKTQLHVTGIELWG